MLFLSYQFEILFVLEVDEASVYDDGYNRKKNKKKKRKQSGTREKKLKAESKSKKEANKIINTQNIDIKLEIKTEVDDISTFEDISQENSDEIPVIQGNYNDNIIIENEPIEDPLKIEFPEVVDKSTKKRKKHTSSHSGQKKIRLKHTFKNKSKHDNMSFYTHTPNLDIPNANVQHKNMALTDLHSVHTVKDISNNEGKINALPGNIISRGNELSMTNMKDKTIINITNSNQMTNFDCSNDNGTEILTNNTVENKATNTCLLKDIKSDTREVISNSYSLKNNYNSIVQKNSGYQNESTNAVTYMKQDTKLKTTMSTEHETIKNKNLIKAPRLSIPSHLSVRLIPENTAASQKTLSHSNMDMANILDPRSATQSANILFPNTTFHHNNPPVLENELEVSHVGNDNILKSIPQLENFARMIPPDTAITPIKTEDNSLFSNNNVLNRSVFNPNVRLEKTVSMDNFKETGGKKFWGNSPYIRYSGTASKPVQAPNSAAMNKGNIQIQKTSFYMLSNTMPRPPVICNYSSIASVNNMTYFQNTSNALNVTNSTPAIVPSRSKQATTKSATRQKSQKRQTSRKKSSSKNDKSNNNTLMDTSRTNVTSTSIGTQVNHPIDVSPLNYNPSNEDNVSSRVTNTQDMIWSMYSSMEMKSAVDDVQPSKSENIPSSNISGNKEQLEDSIKPPINIHPHLSSSKRSQISILRKNPKEKLKKSTTRKKQTTATIAPAIEVTRDQTDAKLMQSADVSQSSTSMIPGHISEMIYPNIPNNDLLRAFNNYWSAQVSHCAICATFASSMSGNSRVMPPDWRYCQSTMLPEDTPIWVRKIKVS